MSEAKKGWYSAAAAAQMGTAWWRTVDGDEVEVTCVFGDCGWPDAQYRGEVVEWVRCGRPALFDDTYEERVLQNGRLRETLAGLLINPEHPDLPKWAQIRAKEAIMSNPESSADAAVRRQYRDEERSRRG